MGIGQGMLPLVGYNYGAHNKQRVSEVVVKSSVTGFLWGLLCWVAALPKDRLPPVANSVVRSLLVLTLPACGCGKVRLRKVLEGVPSRRSCGCASSDCLVRSAA